MEVVVARPTALPVEEKVRIVLAVLAGELNTAQAARQAKVSEHSVSDWKQGVHRFRPRWSGCRLGAAEAAANGRWRLDRKSPGAGRGQRGWSGVPY